MLEGGLDETGEPQGGGQFVCRRKTMSLLEARVWG